MLDFSYERYQQDIADRRASACSSFVMTNSGFSAEINLESPTWSFSRCL